MKIKLLFNLFIILTVPVFLFAQDDPVNWTKNQISDTLQLAKKFYVADLDLDADYDITAVGSNTNTKQANVVWYENDGSTSFTFHSISRDYTGARSVWAADITGNSYPDVLSGTVGKYEIKLWKNDGSPADDDDNWSSQTIGPKDSTVYSIYSADIDKDGDQDVVASYYNIVSDDAGDKVRLFTNNGLSGEDVSFTTTVIVQDYEAATSVFIADINEDGELDILTTAGGESSGGNPGKDVSWWENDDSENFSQHSVTTAFNGPWHIEAADVDLDGDQDILVAGWGAQELAWWPNNGDETFASKQVIKSGFTRARSIQSADVDGDGDMDIIGTADSDNTIAWYENDGSENFTEHVISGAFQYAYFSLPFDLDGDGDMDIIGSAQDDNEISWWESDLEETATLASGDPAIQYFNDNKLTIDFDNTYSGGDVSVFYNHGNNSNRNQLASGIHHIAVSGYYTIVCDASTYNADIEFFYQGLSEWSAVDDPDDLVVCYWDVDAGTNGQWVTLDGTQTVDGLNGKVTVSGVDIELHTYSLFTMGSTTSDNSLPVELIAFGADIDNEGIHLFWQTESEVENLGFELWKKSQKDSLYHLVASHLTNEHLKGLGTSGFGKRYFYSDYSVQTGETYHYKLVDVSFSGKKFEHNKLRVDFVPEQMIKISGMQLPETVQLMQNYPNPFNHSTRINFSLPATADGLAKSIRIEIFDMQGKRIKTVYEGTLVDGMYSTVWDGRNTFGQTVASGTYIYRMQVNDQSIMKRMTLIR